MPAISSIRTDVFQPYYNSQTGLAERCRNLRPHELQAIQDCAELKAFLPDAIKFLQSGHGEMTQQVAHYLMGKQSYLPEGLNHPLNEIPNPIKTLLHDLLRTQRYSFMGKAEDSTKTLTKLQFLNNQLSGYAEKLADWENNAPSEEEDRATAVHLIYECMYENKNYLLLMRLGLTSVPPLPQELIDCLETFSLSANKLTSLSGMPAQMSELKSLSFSQNQLTSLEGLPTDLSNLESLRLHENQLTELTGMPANLRHLKNLELNNNQITSLAGLPTDLSNLESLMLHNNQITSLAGMPPELNRLYKLRLDKNQLTSLAGISSGLSALESMDLQSNQLTTFDGMSWSGLPRSVMINGYSNPLTQEAIHVLLNLDISDIYFDMRAHEETEHVGTLRQELKKWFRDMDVKPWTSYGDIDQKNLATFLMQLHRCKAFDRDNRRNSLSALREILKCMQEDSFFKEYCLNLVQESLTNCEDNIQASFEDMRMQLMNPATKNKSTLNEVKEYYIGREKIALLNNYVARIDNHKERLESVMLLQHALSTELNLPIQFNPIRYAEIAMVFSKMDEYKEQATQFVKIHLKPENVIKTMLEEAPAVDFLKRTYEATFVAHNLLWADALAQASAISDPADTPERTDFDSKLDTARKLLVGSGHEFKNLHAMAELEILKEVATHAMENSNMSELERTEYEINKLTSNSDWIKYVNRADVREEMIKRFELGGSTSGWSDEDWTLEALGGAMSTS